MKDKAFKKTKVIAPSGNAIMEYKDLANRVTNMKRILKQEYFQQVEGYQSKESMGGGK